MKKSHILSVVFLAVAVSSPAVPSAVEPTDVESFALDKSEAGYTVEYDAAPQIATYAEIVYRTYQDSLAMAELMQTAIEDFLTAPSEKTLAAARRTRINARIPYSRTEAFRFYQGPIDFVDASSGEEGPEERINAWPLNEAFIGSL